MQANEGALCYVKTNDQNQVIEKGISHSTQTVIDECMPFKRDMYNAQSSLPFVVYVNEEHTETDVD